MDVSHFPPPFYIFWRVMGEALHCILADKICHFGSRICACFCKIFRNFFSWIYGRCNSIHGSDLFHS